MSKTKLHYVVIRYMLNELADEAANVGIVAIADGLPGVIDNFLDDPTIKSRHDARVRKDVVQRFLAHVSSLRHRFEGKPISSLEAASVFEEMREYNSGILRTSALRTVLTSDISEEVKLLFKQWVQPSGRTARPLTGIPRDPLGGLRKEASSTLVKLFRKGYGSPLSTKIFHRKYEVEGITNKNVIDLAMIERKGRDHREHLFHHVLLLPNAEESFNQAAGLSCRWVDIMAQNGANRDLTAVLYKRVGQPVKGAEDAKRLLNESSIEVATLEDLPKLAAKLKGQPDQPELIKAIA